MNSSSFGDIQAFEVIFNDYYAGLVAYAKTIIKNTEEAEDIVQQVFIMMWEKRKTAEIHTSVRALLYKSVYNSCLNRIKQLKVRANYSKEFLVTSERVSVQTSFQKNELQEKINEALTFLPEQCRKIFQMSRFEQLKYQEIADQLGISLKTVENQMGKALKIMREQLKEYLPLLFILLSNFYRG